MQDKIANVTKVVLFSIIIFLGSFIRLNFGPAVVIMQNALCVLAGVVIGAKLGTASVALWQLALFLGLPVASGGRGSIAVLLTAWGGFYPGMLLGAFVAGLIVKKSTKWRRVILATVSGMLSLYLVGVPWYAIYMAKFSPTALSEKGLLVATITAMIPCVLADAIKVIIITPISFKMRKFLIF